jgi:TfoX/Sxy family transcriptional regulator of competence genes
MPYNQDLDVQIRAIVDSWPHITTKKMFGGVCYLLNGNMLGGVYQDYLICRLGAAEAAQALEKPYVKPFDISGRPMKGWVMVAMTALGTPSRLVQWLESAKAFTERLPAK